VKAGNLQGIEFKNSDWTDPRELDFPLNVESTIGGCSGAGATTGHEDSAFVSADGQRLFFAYRQITNEAIPGLGLDCFGPGRPGQHGRKFDLYEAPSLFSYPINLPVNIERHQTTKVPFFGLDDVSLGVNEDLDTMAFMRADTDTFASGARSEHLGDIWISHQPASSPYDPYAWDEPDIQRVDGMDAAGDIESGELQVNTPCMEDDIHVVGSRTDFTLYFDSDRDPAPFAGSWRSTHVAEDCDSPRNLWQASYSSSGGWSNLKRVPGADTGDGVTSFDGHAFVSLDELNIHWLGRQVPGDPDKDCGIDGSGNGSIEPVEEARGCFYKATRASTTQSFDTTNMKVIAAPTSSCTATVGDVDGIGEMSITSDERYLYFVFRKKVAAGDRICSECNITPCCNIGEPSCTVPRYDISLGVARNSATTDPW
ncbi:MAG: hypothetical protein K8I02_12130, partial [Candidatus Methylomirabilis sp.]|nr:hypothetical protein [Deltaproteobacteria bacterium]